MIDNTVQARAADLSDEQWLDLGMRHAGCNLDGSDFLKFIKAVCRDYAALTAQAAVELAPSRAGRVYLAGPMTGYAEFNFPAFNAAAAKLRATGAEVVNPAEHGIVAGAEWEDYLRFDIAKIAVCESIALLPGWSKSRGATLEVHVAQALGMALQYLDGAEPAPGAAPSATAPADAPIEDAAIAVFTASQGPAPMADKLGRIDAILRAWLAPAAPVVEPGAQAGREVEDSARLDWLDRSRWYVGPEYDSDEAGGIHGYDNHTGNLREAIDSARATQGDRT